MQSYSAFQNFTLFVLRAVIAAVFLVAGYYKLPFWNGTHPEMSATDLIIVKIVCVAEFLGGVAVFIGFLTRWAALGFTIIMLGAIYYVQFKYHMGFVTPTSAGWNFPLAVLGGCVVLIAFGAGAWSIDAGRRGR